MSGMSAAVIGVVAQSAHQGASGKADASAQHGEADAPFMAVLSSRMKVAGTESTSASSSSAASEQGGKGEGKTLPEFLLVPKDGEVVAAAGATESANANTGFLPAFVASTFVTPTSAGAVQQDQPTALISGSADSENLASEGDKSVIRQVIGELTADVVSGREPGDSAKPQEVQAALFLQPAGASASIGDVDAELSVKAKLPIPASNKPSVAKTLVQSAANSSREAASSAAADRSSTLDLSVASSAGSLKYTPAGQAGLDFSQIGVPGVEAKVLTSAVTSSPMPGQFGQLVGQAAVGMGEAQARVQTLPVQLSVDAPLRSPIFTQELGDRVAWMSGRQIQVAEISLNPAHLGPLEVRIAMSGGEMGAQFFSPHAQVREALDAALPRLREMLADAGVTLGQANVRDESLSRQSAFSQSGNGGKADQDALPLEVADGQIAVGVMSHHRLGEVDLYV